jgi:PAS domain S-box-containing protein
MGKKYEPSVIDQSTKEKLFGAELWLNAILENNLLSIIVLKSVRDKKGAITDFEFQFLNRKAVESVRGKELTGKRLLVEFPNARPSKIFDNYVYVVETGKSWEDEVHMTHAGYDSWSAVKATRLEDGCLVLYSDITAQKKIEQELFQIKDEVAKLATDKYLSLINNIDQGFCIQEIIFDENGKTVDCRFLEVNPAFEKLTGLKNVVGRTIREFDPSLENIWFEKFGEVVKTGKSVHFQSKASGLAGGALYDVYAFRIDKLETRHVAVLFNDITRKKAELELKEQNHFIKQITDTTPDILFVADLSGTLIYASKGLSLLGYAHKDFYTMKGEEFKSLLHPEDVAKTESFNDNLKTIGPEEVRETMFRLMDVNGKYHWLNVRYRCFKVSPEGRTAQVLGIARDITEEIEAEKAFHDEKTRNVELKRINELMDTFVFAAAHDLKSPVSNLRLLTELIADTDDEQMRLRLQEKYSPILDTLESTISGLVKVLEIEKYSGPGIKNIRFAEALNLVIAELHDQITRDDAQIKADFSACETILYPDSFIRSIFRNLLSNALKYRHPDMKPLINIMTNHSGNYIIVNFTDNGIGIDLENYGKDMFKPFKRFSSHTEGSGLGLHLVKSIVTKNGGKIEIESEPDRGTTFRIFLVQYSK